MKRPNRRPRDTLRCEGRSQPMDPATQRQATRSGPGRAANRFPRSALRKPTRSSWRKWTA
eukprot:5243420-Alexandrium_andersonii.AAC.2